MFFFSDGLLADFLFKIYNEQIIDYHSTKKKKTAHSLVR